MTIEEWRARATADADRRNLPELKALLDSFAQSLHALRSADFNDSPDARLNDARLEASPDSSSQDAGLKASRFSNSQDARLKASRYGTNDSELSIEAFGARLRRGETTSREVTERCLRRIGSDDGRLNAFILVLADQAREQARIADAELARGIDRGPLHGVPISIKDLIDVRGTPTTAASRVREGHVAGRDAAVIAHLREAGAVLIGKTNLHEFAFGTTNEESAFGLVRNPYDHGRSPGGSSGGSAVSVAAGMALATVGTDTGGSIRIPSAACGIVGLKPAFGDISTDGVVPLSRSLDHVGPLARSITDAWLVYRALAGDHHPNTLHASAEGTRQTQRLGVLRRYFCEPLDDDVRGRFDAALERLRDAGARIEEVAISHAAEIVPVYMTIVFSEAAAYHAATLEATPERYSASVRMRLEVGRYLPAEDLARALIGRELLRKEVDAALAPFDALVLPTLPITAPPLGAQSLPIGGSVEPVRTLMLRNTQLFNLTGHPAISMPCGTTVAGLPCGIELVGQETQALVRTALGVERVLHTFSTSSRT